MHIDNNINVVHTNNTIDAVVNITNAPDALRGQETAPQPLGVS